MDRVRMAGRGQGADSVHSQQKNLQTFYMSVTPPAIVIKKHANGYYWGRFFRWDPLLTFALPKHQGRRGLSVSVHPIPPQLLRQRTGTKDKVTIPRSQYNNKTPFFEPCLTKDR